LQGLETVDKSEVAFRPADIICPKAMSAYLLSWNPKRSSFTDERYRDEFPDSPGDWLELSSDAPQSESNLKRAPQDSHAS
jgi:hypothetical protein